MKLTPPSTAAPHQRVGLFLAELPDLAPHIFAAAAERHGAEADFRDEKAGAAKLVVAHG